MTGSLKSSVRVAPIPKNKNIRHSSFRNLLVPFVLNNDNNVQVPPVDVNHVPVATKGWLIRAACGQIVHALDDISETLSHQLLQELCAELVVRSSTMIQSKVDKFDQSIKGKEEENKDVHISSSNNINEMDPTNEHRKVEMVNRNSSRPLSVVKSPTEDLALQNIQAR